MKQTVFLLISFLMCRQISGQQDTLKLENCLSIAVSRSVLNRQKSNSEALLTHKIKSLNSNWIPSVGLNAQAVYNSETIDLSDLMGNAGSTPSLPLDQYKIWADINQQIFDGGSNKALKQAEKAIYETDVQQTEAELLTIRQQVNQVYFSMLLARMNSEVLEISLNELSQRKEILKSAVKNGILLPDNLLAMEAEEINLKQKITELRMLKEQYLRIMFILLDTTLMGNIVVAEPGEPVVRVSEIRPELKMFDSQRARISANQQLVISADLPKFFAFTQLAWGRPGYNMISSDFHTFYTIGAGMKWNFLNYGDNKRQMKILEIQKDQIEIKRTQFSNQLNIQIQTELINIEKYDSLMKQDTSLLSIRRSIASSSLSKLNNGIITSMEYLTDMNAELLANLQYQNHKLLKKQATYNYLLLQGKL